MSGAVLVVGSLNMDFVVGVERLPAPGETVLGRDFQTIPGGKGANQACAAGKLSGGSVPVRMVGRVGKDPFAAQLRESLAAAGVDTGSVLETASQPTGVALISVENSGQNCIVVASGANHAITAADLESARPSFRGTSHVLLQLEIPLPVVAAAARIAREEGAMTILDPAPAQPLPSGLLAQVDLLTPNESEAQMLAGRQPARIEPAEAPALAGALMAMGARRVVVKLGDAGCYFTDGAQEFFSPGFRVLPRDTTAAGDTFNGALAVALAEGQSWGEALRWANAAAAISVTRLGAQASIPTRQEVESFLEGELT